MEYFDIYDENRIKTGRTMLRGTPMKSGDHRIVVHICIFTPDGKMIIQQRQPFKHGWSNMWDVTVGGSAQAGETSAMAAVRELSEEVGIVLPQSELRPTITINSGSVFDDYYTGSYDGDISKLVLQTEEVQQIKTASADEIKAMIDSGEFIPYHKSFIDLLFHLKDSKDTRTGPDKSKHSEE